MTSRRFSNQHLYNLRNKIPVAIMIEKGLKIPCRTTEGVFRFLCPSCNEFNTAVNSKTNLARCFRCEKNFNTIDLVMLVKKMDFVNTISFLNDYLKNIPTEHHPRHQNVEDKNQHPQHIGGILKSIIPHQPVMEPFESSKRVNERIVAIEQKLEYLAHQIKEISKAFK
ncbi:MAG: CHC2 zinc finger domain-containing protein [Thermodesulfobacteriota bacterium]|nr:CHC2 zinc finger domain-containing protein [Thermodesulfobacteriota bacterium]